VTLTITHPESGAKREIKSNAAGAFEFVGLPSGNYTMTALAMGFKPFEVPLQLAGGKTTRQDITLDVGTLQETITVRDGPPVPAAPRRAMSSSSSPGTCSAQPNSGGLMPPTKTHDTRPIYPTAYRGTDVEGRVSLKATIGVDGAVRTVQMVEATNADFDQAAQDAVRQWRFTPTLLNCVPVEVEMNVLTTFRPETAPPPPPPPPPAR
jgi:TonB family protein